MTKCQPMEQFSILKLAGVGVGVFASYYGFGRVSVSMWINGRAEPHSLHRSQVLSALDEVKKAYDDGRLPLKAPVHRNQALIAFSNAMKESAAD